MLDKQKPHRGLAVVAPLFPEAGHGRFRRAGLRDRKSSNVANADKASVASFAVTLEILPIRQSRPDQTNSLAP